MIYSFEEHFKRSPKKILLFLSVLLVLSSCDKQEHTQSLHVDLTKTSWRLCQGFAESYQTAIPIDVKDCKALEGFPILIDRIFPLKPGSGMHEFSLETKFDLADSENKRLTLSLPVIGENWEVFLNGVSLRREIFLDQEGTIAKYRVIKGVLINLPPSALKREGNTLIIHVLGNASVAPFYYNDYLGFYMESGYAVTDIDKFQMRAAEFLSFMLYPVYFFFGIYHIILFLGNRQQRYNLWFGIFCAALASYCVLISNTVFDIFPILDTSYLKKAEFISLFFMLPSMLYFLRDYFEPGLWRPVSRSVLVWNIALSLLVLVIPFDYAKVILPIWQIAALFQLVLLLVLMTRFVIREGLDAYIMGGTFAFALFSAVWDIVASLFVFSDLRFFQAAFFLFIISIVMTIALRLRRLEKSERMLNEELRALSMAFYRFVPTQVLEEMDKKSASDLKVGDNALRMMSVLFSDIRGFTALSEQMTADDNFKFLNSYLERMEPLIADQAGYVDKFLGDGIMALFSATTAAEQHGRTTSDRALNAAIAMRRDVPQYNFLREKIGYASIDIGIGLHTGPLIIGAIGSSNRIDTTVIGNTVNLASRIEGMTSAYKAGIIVSEALYLDLTDPGKYFAREIGSIIAKGKTRSTTLYEIFDTDLPEIIELKQKTSPHLSAGLAFYKEKHFKEARREFREALLVFSTDPVARVYYKMSGKFMTEPTPENWQGAIQVMHK